MLKDLHGSEKSSTFAAAFETKPESVAQQVEHIPFKDGVLGSSPSWFTRLSNNVRQSFFILW